jgi:hypothetical protein
MLILALLLAAAAPQPSEVRTFQDWAVACDNGLTCEAVALMPEAAEGDKDWSGWVTLMLRRGGRAGDAPVLMLQNVDGAPAVLLADERPVAARFSSGIDGDTVIADPEALVAMLRGGRVLELRDAAGASLGRISLAGASAAMLYMDERQRRLDTVTALVRRGARPASAVPAPPALPRVTRAAAATDRAPAIPERLVAPLRERAECDPPDILGDRPIQAEPIATGITLVLVPCMRGAYNFSTLAVIAERRGGRLAVREAPFDFQSVLESDQHPILVNAMWDAEERRLHEYSRGRGLGDCGTRADYAWDGASFRLVRQEEMPECRGSLYYVTTWRAVVVGP